MFRVEGLNEFREGLERSGRTTKRESRLLLEGLGDWAIGRVKAYTLEAGAVDLGELVQGVHRETRIKGTTTTVTVRPSDAADVYAIFVEKGTRPHFPPIRKLQGWADRHGIPVWAVALKIAREGTEPRHMWRDTYNDLSRHIDQPAERFLDKVVRSI